MSQFGWVDPGNTSNISTLDFPPASANRAPIALITGNTVYVPKIAAVRLDESPRPQWDLYTLVLSTDQPPGGLPLEYFTSVLTYAFRNTDDSGPGVVGDPTSIVQETRVYSEIPIADLYERKRQEVANQDQTVRYNAADTSLAANWWLVITQDARFELDGIQGNWLQRQIDGQGFPSGPNAPWVGIYNANTAAGRRQQVTDATQWDTLYLEKTQHDQATGNATDASNTALDAAYADGAGDWQAVADHDAADPAWGYPPTIVLQL